MTYIGLSSKTVLTDKTVPHMPILEYYGSAFHAKELHVVVTDHDGHVTPVDKANKSK